MYYIGGPPSPWIKSPLRRRGLGANLVAVWVNLVCAEQQQIRSNTRAAQARSEQAVGERKP